MSELVTTEFFPAAFWTDGTHFVRLTDDGEYLYPNVTLHGLEWLGVQRRSRVSDRGLDWRKGDLRTGEFLRNECAV